MLLAVLATLGCNRQRLLLFAYLGDLSGDGGVEIFKRACFVGKAYTKFLHDVAGRPLMYTLKRVGAITDPCGRPLFCTIHELLMSPMRTRNRRCSMSSLKMTTAVYSCVLLPGRNPPCSMFSILSTAGVMQFISLFRVFFRFWVTTVFFNSPVIFQDNSA